jgi:hypothetical protein
LSKPTKSKQKVASPAGGDGVAKGGGFRDGDVDPSCLWILWAVPSAHQKLEPSPNPAQKTGINSLFICNAIF